VGVVLVVQILVVEVVPVDLERVLIFQSQQELQ
jgi:hypothetical protein